jgi:sec-independent protein translocase protein TatB
MFDIGFWELALIGVVALLVVGPDRLPGLARTVGLWVGRIRRYVATVRDDIEREIQADELRTLLEKRDDLNPLKEVIDETSSTISDANKELAGVQKQADELISADSGESEAAEKSASVGPSPDSAATSVARAVSARNEASAPAESQAESREDTKSDEQRSS